MSEIKVKKIYRLETKSDIIPLNDEVIAILHEIANGDAVILDGNEIENDDNEI